LWQSLCARAIAGDWKIPLVKFDTAAKFFDKYIGETEKRIFKKVFQVAEGLSPCVLWIDELEKVFAAVGRIRLPRMRESLRAFWLRFFPGCRTVRQPVFVVATCNNVHRAASRVNSQGTL